MKLLVRLFDFYLDTSLHVAFSVVMLLWVTSHYLGISLDPKLVGFVFFATVSTYIFIKYVSAKGKYVLSALPYHRSIQILGLVCSGSGLWCLGYLNWSPELFLLLTALLLFTTAYALPLLPSNVNLRGFGLLKISLVALVWAGATVVLPVIHAQLDFSWDVGVEALQRFVLVVILMLPFEVRDMQYDLPELRTFPRRYGLGKTKIFGLGLVLVFFLLTFFKDGPREYEPITKGLLSVFLVCILWVTKEGRGRYFASFWVEAVPIFWGIALWLSGD